MSDEEQILADLSQLISETLFHKHPAVKGSSPGESGPGGKPAPRYVFLERPRCPECEGTNLETIRSQLQEDESRKRTIRCRVCGTRFFLILE